MNKINYNQTGGFPLNTEALTRLEDAYKVFNGLGALAGPTAIIEGCVVTGTAVSKGTVYINGEIFEFRAGALAANVVIREVEVKKEFRGGDTKPVYYERYVEFGVSSTNSYPWANFKRVLPTTETQPKLDLKEEKTVVTALTARVTALESKDSQLVAKDTELQNQINTLNTRLGTAESKLSGIAAGAEVNVQANWIETDASSDAYVLNKPLQEILYKGKLTLTDIPAGNHNILVSLDRSIDTANYTVLGSFVSEDAFSPNATLLWTVRDRHANYFQIIFRETEGVVQSGVEFEYIIIRK